MPKTSAALEPQVLAAIQPGDAVMVKGSLGSRMGPIVKALQRRYSRATRRRRRQRKVDPMLYWLSAFSDTFRLAQRLPLHHLPHRRRDDHGAALRVPVRAARSSTSCALQAGQGPADPHRRPAVASRHQEGHADHGRADDPVRRSWSRRCCGPISANPYVWIVLGVTLGFGAIGFYDDYLKVTKQTHAGLLRQLAPRCIEVADRGARPATASCSLGRAAVRDLARPFRSSRTWCCRSAGSSSCSAPSSSSAPATR